MGSKKDHKHKKEHKHKHHRRHRRSDSEERSPVAKRKYEPRDEPDRHSSSKRRRGEEKSKKDKHRRDYDASPREEKRPSKPKEVEEVVEEEEVYVPPPEQNNDAEIPDQAEGQSLSIEETNRIRAKLGLKPLQVNSSAGGGENGASGRSQDEFVHAPAADLWKQKKEKEMREKLQASRDRRKMNQRMSKVKTLGEEEEEESASSWVVRSRERQENVKKEKELAAVGDQFGVDKLVKKELGHPVKQEPAYSEKDLKGMNVEHSLDSFVDGKSAILVIKDKEILASDDEDVLHSVNIDDVEKAKKNLDIKRRGTGYKAYEEEEVDEMGFFKAKSTLGKYDEEIEGEKKNRFTIGDRGTVDTSWEQQKIAMKQEIRAKGETLELPALKLASEYLTEEEMKFKKRKRKVKKVRKRETLKADDLVPLPGETSGKDHGSRSKPEPGKIPGWDEGVEITKTRYNQATVMEEDNQVIHDDEEVVDELQRALQKTRRAKQKKSLAPDDYGALKVAQHLETVSQANLEKPEEQYTNPLFLNATDEFCRQLGNPVKNPSNSQEQDMDIESDHEEEEEMQTSAWSSVDPSKVEVAEKPTKSQETHEDHAPIEAEPLAANGLLGALKLAERKGYLSEETAKKGNLIVTTNKNSSLYSKNYAIEDKNAVDYLDKYANEKYTKDRSRYDRGVVSDFVEKKDYKPKVAIEYVDEHGKNMSAKEAFRTLSHRFHGKGSGKSKQEKRMKKAKEEETMKHMSSTDTPLNTVAMMKEKLRSESSPYIVLSGAGKTLMAGGSLSKSK